MVSSAASFILTGLCVRVAEARPRMSIFCSDFFRHIHVIQLMVHNVQPRPRSFATCLHAHYL